MPHGTTRYIYNVFRSYVVMNVTPAYLYRNIVYMMLCLQTIFFLNSMLYMHSTGCYTCTTGCSSSGWSPPARFDVSDVAVNPCRLARGGA